MSSLPYGEGTWFAVPLLGGGFAVGIIVRMAIEGKIAFGYFFGPRQNAPPSLDEVIELRPNSAIWLTQFGDLGLFEGTWPIIGRDPHWNRNKWIMPPFGCREPLRGLAWKVTYSDEDIGQNPIVTRVKPEEIEGLPEDSMAGAGFVEKRLTRLLSE